MRDIISLDTLGAIAIGLAIASPLIMTLVPDVIARFFHKGNDIPE